MNIVLKPPFATAKLRENTSQIWDPPVSIARAPAPVVIAIEADLIALLSRPIDPTETHREGNDRKERELRVLLDRLSPCEAHALQQRLAAGRQCDPIVTAFTRIVADRRARILAFIADTRRRVAVCVAR